jgi:hypothetical protein
MFTHATMAACTDNALYQPFAADHPSTASENYSHITIDNMGMAAQLKNTTAGPRILGSDQFTISNKVHVEGRCVPFTTGK